MIYDQWRAENGFAEVNNLPSMTEPVKVPSISDYLRDPSLVLRQKSGMSEGFDNEPSDVPDSFEFEVPRDPDLYSSMRERKPSANRTEPDKAPGASSKPAEEPAKKPDTSMDPSGAGDSPATSAQ